MLVSPRISHRLGVLFLGALAGLLVSPGLVPVTRAQEPSALQRKTRHSFHGPDGAGKDGSMATVGPRLIRLYHAYRQHQTEEKAGSFESTQPLMPVVEGTYVVIDAVASSDPVQLRDDLEALGLRNGATAGRVVSGLLPIGALKGAARLSSLRSAAPSMASTGPPPRGAIGRSRAGGGGSGAAKRTIGETITQGDVSLYADRARERFGADGSGVKACVLSDSYDENDNAATTAREDVRNGDLPGAVNPDGYAAPVEVLEDYGSYSNLGPGVDEGRAMLQIIHDVAPGARLGFHTAGGGLANFAQGIRELAGAGCGIIVDDIIYFAEPMFQNGLITQAIEEVTANEGAAYFTAAGNSAAQSYAAPYRSSGQLASSIGIDGSGALHDFDPGSGTDVRQEVTVWKGRTAILVLQWDDPFFRVSGGQGADTDLDLYLLDGEDVVARATRDNTGGDPWEVLAYRNAVGPSRTLDLAIVRNSGPDPGRLKYADSPNGNSVSIEEYDTSSPTSYGHFGAGPGISTAASAWYVTPRVPEGASPEGTDPPLVNGFSSKGDIPLLFDGDGNRLSPPMRRETPDLAAPDAGNTTFFGFDVPDEIDTDDFPNFFGTSAAAPHAAAVAALMRDVRPDLSPGQIERHLEREAVDVRERGQIFGVSPIEGRTAIPDGEGDDRFSGAGLIRADRAVRSVLSTRIVDIRAEGEAASGSPTAPFSLRWRTAFERSSKGFLVERRAGPLTPRIRRSGGGWTRVGSVPSKAQGGESTDTLRYRFEGEMPTPGTYALRLRHVTEGGPEEGHRVGVATEMEVPIGGAYSLGGPQPNPSGGTVEIELVVEEGQDVRIVLYDVLGRRVQVLYDNSLGAKTPLLLRTEESGLASGTYFLQVVGEAFAETRTMIVVR